KKELHNELKKDYGKFSIHLTLNDFYKENKEYIDKPILEFTNWINKENINEEYVFDLLFQSEHQSVYDVIRRKFENIDPSNFSDEDFFVPLGGYIDVGEIEWYSCEDIDIDIIKDCSIISGTLHLNAELEFYGYNSVRDTGDEKFPYCGSKEAEVKVLFNFCL